ncbi:hypothetical protein FSP39_006972 [Pinctada imbricata]|uniref:L-Fucosyltransferase n=1 Tax=Pinctada imbricata TaxID=66713 RepID=A0AA89BJ67_PINIB|nr:hypothetical protein FSP39_006972 [Pinctada imbricata]
MNMVKTGTFNLQDVFDLGENFSFDESFHPSYCGCYTVLENEFDCGFDPKLNLWSNRKGVYLSGYFQSWRYFIQEENEIRRMFIFKEEIRTRVALQLRNLLRGTNWNYDTHQLVGVHIRRGDFTAPPEAAFGYITAPIDYVTRAMRRMRSFYSRVIFLVCSDEILWAKKRLDKEPDVLFSEDNTAAEDLALLSLTNHTIITVGTFGWWAAFFTNGTKIYYKHAFVKNSKLAAQYPNESTEDFFPPAWIGME